MGWVLLGSLWGHNGVRVGSLWGPRAVPSGSYSSSAGLDAVRADVAQFLQRRDGFPSRPQNIFLSSGASEAIVVGTRPIGPPIHPHSGPLRPYKAQFPRRVPIRPHMVLYGPVWPYRALSGFTIPKSPSSVPIWPHIPI